MCRFLSFVIICIVVGDLDPVIKRGVFGVPLTGLTWHILFMSQAFKQDFVKKKALLRVKQLIKLYSANN